MQRSRVRAAIVRVHALDRADARRASVAAQSANDERHRRPGGCAAAEDGGSTEMHRSMRTRLILTLAGLPILAAALVASAADPAAGKIDWKACEKEIAQFACKGSDQEVWSCLEKHDTELSQACQEPHAKGDKLFKK
jgi:hypothetical protein